MTMILQTQRRAIESFYPVKYQYPLINFGDLYKLEDGTKLHVLGVSRGVGMCSDIYSMNVLVLGLKKPSMKPVLRGAITSCRYAVLLREASAQEKGSKAGPSVLLTVELLQTGCNGRPYFIRTGKAKPYVNLV